MEVKEMQRDRGSVLLGVLLVLLGLLFLAATLGIVSTSWELLWVVAFGLAGLWFLALFAANRDRWWAAVPGFTLLGLATVIYMEELSPRGADVWSGTVFLGAIGFSFFAVYLSRGEHWWALIPAGTLLTLSLVAGIERTMPGQRAGGVFLLGLGLTFLAVYLIPSLGRRQLWAVVPAAILLFLGAATIAASTRLFDIVVPVGLILLGGYLLLRGRRPGASAAGYPAGTSSPDRALEKTDGD